MKLIVQRMCLPDRQTVEIGFPLSSAAVVDLEGGGKLATLVYEDAQEALADASRFLEAALGGVRADAVRAGKA